MKLSVFAAAVLSLALAGSACDTARDPDTTAARFDETTPSTGTAATDQGAEPESALGQDLPDTASPLALIGGVGLMALAGAAGVRLARRR